MICGLCFIVNCFENLWGCVCMYDQLFLVPFLKFNHCVYERSWGCCVLMLVLLLG